MIKRLLYFLFFSLCFVCNSFAQNTEDRIVNKQLVLVNIAGFSRDEIAVIVQRVEKFQPKVIGIDAWFTHVKSDTLLLPTLYSYNNIVLAVKLSICKNNKCDSLTGHYFPYAKEGHVMFNYSNLKYAPTLSYQRKKYPFFCLELLKHYDPALVEKYNKRKLYKQPLTFYGNYNSFTTIEGKEFLSNAYSQKWDLKDKIVVLGYLGNTIGEVNDRMSAIDYKRTEISNGKLPDMYGVILLANILTDIMKRTE